MNDKLKIEILNINDLSLEINTIKEHPDWQIEQIANSIKEFGFLDPVGIDEDNFVIEGKGRVLAAQKLGMSEIPCIRLIGLNDNEKRAYIIAHNKLTINTGFDLEALEYELNALKVEDFDLSLTGFSSSEIDELFEEEILSEIPKFNEENLDEDDKKTQEKYLTFNGKKIPITDEEFEKLEIKIKEYLEENGILYGFVSKILLGE